MTKSNKIYIAIIIILSIALIIVTAMFFDMRKNAINNYQSFMNETQKSYEYNKRVHELEEELNELKQK